MPRRALPYRRFLRNLLLALLPVVLAWVVFTPFYNRLLLAAGGGLVHLVESPDVTRLLPAYQDPHYAVVHRLDFPPARRQTGSFRLTDVHFHLVLLGVLFLAVPGVPWQRRLRNLGWALLAAFAFHLVLVLFQVKFIYATQLGTWSAENYGPVARNVWSLGKHLLDLPFKLGLPLALWGAFHLRWLLPREGGEGGG